MRVAAILGPGASSGDLRPFQAKSIQSWQQELPTTSADADAVLIFGGDGTIHRHLPQLVKLQLPVLIVPCGSGNDFARALGIGSRQDALRIWMRHLAGAARTWAVDLGTITSPGSPDPHYFCCVGGVGLDGEAARRANQFPRWLRANGGYVLGLLAALGTFKAPLLRVTSSSTTTADQGPALPVTLAAFANAPAYGGGMKIAPQAKLDDGKLDLCVIGKVGKLKLLSLFPTVYFGGHLGIREVSYSQVDRLRLEAEAPLDVFADGEYVCRTPIEVGIAPKALQVIVHP